MRARLLKTALITATLALLSACQGMPMTSDANDPGIDDPMRGAPPITRRAWMLRASRPCWWQSWPVVAASMNAPPKGYLDAAERYDSAALSERATWRPVSASSRAVRDCGPPLASACSRR